MELVCYNKQQNIVQPVMSDCRLYDVYEFCIYWCRVISQVADFGLAKITSDVATHVSTRVMGTFGYDFLNLEFRFFNRIIFHFFFRFKFYIVI